MKVNTSEFAMIAGVSVGTISEHIKKGQLVRKEGWLDTDDYKNRSYLVEHGKNKKELIESVRESLPFVSKGENFDIFAEEKQSKKVYSAFGKKAIEACESLINYVYEQERVIAEYQGIEERKTDAGTVSFIRYLVQKLDLNGMDNQMTHDCMLMTMNKEYRMTYMNAVKEKRKKMIESV